MIVKKFDQMDDEVKSLLWHHPWDENEKSQAKLLEPDTGAYYYFRRSKSAVNERLTQLIDHRKIPNVFIHGSPHIDNYAKTLAGAGMVDFDRAYVGPYVWDLLCVLLATSFRNPKHEQKPINQQIIDSLLEAYLYSYQHPEEDYQRFEPLENINPKEWELDSRTYLKSEKKWAKRLSLTALETDDPVAVPLLNSFIRNSPDQSQYSAYQIQQIAYASGTFGRKRYIYVLGQDPKSSPILVDIKQTKNYLAMPWRYVRWYKNPYQHDGQRLCEAAKLYAPGFAPGESYATLNGVDYWGRLIPTLNRKPAKIFDEEQQVQFALSAGSQLGRGHRLSLQEISQQDFQQHLIKTYPELVTAAQTIKEELVIVWRAYCQQFGHNKTH